MSHENRATPFKASQETLRPCRTCLRRGGGESHLDFALHIAQKRSQKFKVMKFEYFEREMCGGILGGKIS